MEFYVPTIGDKIYLAEPWTFTLHREHRNLTLADRTKNLRERHHSVPQCKIRRTRNVSNWWSPPLRKGEERIIWTEQLELRIQTGDWEYVEDVDPYNYNTKEWINDQIQITLPTNTRLAIDRIYIRGKGQSYRNFDSITFYIEDCPDKNLAPKKKGGFHKGKVRFWVKLRDANKIVCDLLPIADPEAAQKFKDTAMNRFAFEED